MRTLRLALGAGLLVAAVPLAAPSQARCVPTWAVVCATLVKVCDTVEDLGVIKPNCPVY